MENQHREIKGYRELSPAEIAVMNKVKAHAEETAALIKEVHQLNSVRFNLGLYLLPAGAEMNGESNRWAALAKTQLQQGFMALVRSIALPTTF